MILDSQIYSLRWENRPSVNETLSLSQSFYFVVLTVWLEGQYSQLSPCGHPAITDTPIIRTADKFRAKINYRRLTEINSRYYGLSLQRTLT